MSTKQHRTKSNKTTNRDKPKHSAKPHSTGAKGGGGGKGTWGKVTDPEIREEDVDNQDPNYEDSAETAENVGNQDGSADQVAVQEPSTGDQGREPAAPTWVFAGNLGAKVTNEQLKEFFSSKGNVVDVKIRRSTRSKWGKVNFATEEDAQAALELNGVKLGDFPVIVEPMKHAARPKADPPNEAVLFVGNLNWDLKEEDLQNQFGEYGTLVSVTINRDRRTQRSRGWATVEFTTKEEAAAAIAALDGQEVAERAISVRISTRPSPNPNSQPQRTGQRTALFVGNLARSITSDDLREKFAVYGDIISAEIETFPRKNRSRGFGTVKFETPEQAASAIEGLNGVELNERQMIVEFLKKKPRRRNKRVSPSETAAAEDTAPPTEPRKRAPRRARKAPAAKSEDASVPEEVEGGERVSSRKRTQRVRKPRAKVVPRYVDNPESHVYVRNVPYSASEDDLSAYLSGFGKVVSVTLSKMGWAAVEMASGDDASNVIANANDVEFQGRPLLLRLDEHVTGTPAAEE